MYLFISTALAFTPYDSNAIEERLQQIEPYRAHRTLSTYPQLPRSGHQQAAKEGISTGILYIPNEKLPVAWGIAVFNIKLERLYNAVNDELQHTGMTPVTYTKIITGTSCQHRRQVLMHMPVPLLSDRWWMTTQDNNPSLYTLSKGAVAELSWDGITNPKTISLDEESQRIVQDSVYVSFNKGAWLFITLDPEHTLAEYFSWSDPGGAIPDSLKSYASSFTADSIVSTFSAMERYATENAPKCRIF